ncbi:hypothetical protein M0802_003713 [Mischocyttarus mexicanus]|nr:hypothetical protein M0802_003713 [Mischocyttarus mexicanus]
MHYYAFTYVVALYRQSTTTTITEVDHARGQLTPCRNYVDDGENPVITSGAHIRRRFLASWVDALQQLQQQQIRQRRCQENDEERLKFFNLQILEKLL